MMVRGGRFVFASFAESLEAGIEKFWSIVVSISRGMKAQMSFCAPPRSTARASRARTRPRESKATSYSASSSQRPPIVARSSALDSTSLTALPPAANAATAAHAAATCERRIAAEAPAEPARPGVDLVCGELRALQTADWTMSTHWVPEMICFVVGFFGGGGRRSF